MVKNDLKAKDEPTNRPSDKDKPVLQNRDKYRLIKKKRTHSSNHVVASNQADKNM